MNEPVIKKSPKGGSRSTHGTKKKLSDKSNNSYHRPQAFFSVKRNNVRLKGRILMTLSCPLSPLHATSDLARSAGMRRRPGRGEARRCRVVTSRMIMGGKREIDLPKCQRVVCLVRASADLPKSLPRPLMPDVTTNGMRMRRGGKPPKEINHKGKKKKC